MRPLTNFMPAQSLTSDSLSTVVYTMTLLSMHSPPHPYSLLSTSTTINTTALTPHTLTPDCSINQWFKIPYAVAPLGNLRWHAPQPIDSRDPWGSGLDPIDATRPGPACVQGNPAWQWTDFNRPPDTLGSEDCLHINVMVPDVRPGPLPVLVKIHGGGYAQGSADWSDGFAVLKHTKGGVVYVSMQYRLGAYGFLASEEVKADGVANAGLLDQRLALNFIKKYVNKFGGDPDRITIFGGSAGGGSVTAHLMMFGAKKETPFRAAVAGE
jgi:carboxylesterase type B